MPLVNNGELHLTVPAVCRVSRCQCVNPCDTHRRARIEETTPVRVHLQGDDLTNDFVWRDDAMRDFLTIERERELTDQFLSVRDDDRGPI